MKRGDVLYADRPFVISIMKIILDDLFKLDISFDKLNRLYNWTNQAKMSRKNLISKKFWQSTFDTPEKHKLLLWFFMEGAL